jgi:hypothetical protein
VIPSFDDDELFLSDPERAIGLGVPSLSLGVFQRWFGLWQW